MGVCICVLRDVFPMAMDATVAIIKDDNTSQSVNVNPLVDLIWKNEAAIVNIFDIKKSTLRRSNVEMFWLSLICSGIIDIVVKSDGSAQFKLDVYWTSRQLIIKNVI